MTWRLLVLVAAAVVAGIAVPAFANPTTLNDTALALALAGPAAGAAVAAAAGRPLVAAAALAGTGAYVSGLLSLHGVPVPLAVVLGAGAGAAAGALIGLLGARLEGATFLAAGLLLVLLGAAAVQALPGLTGAESGLGPLPGLGVALGPNRTAVLTQVGNFHAMLAVSTALVVAAALLLQRGPGPRWRAVGSDVPRAEATRLRPLAAQCAALAVAGVLSALPGALAAHVSQVASPSYFALDTAAVPLLAALAANRRPVGAALTAVATGAVGRVVLPLTGWHGPPDAMAVAIGILAVAALATLLPSRGGEAPAREEPPIDAAEPWPVDTLGLRGAGLEVPAVQRRAPSGELLLDAPAFTVAPGAVQAVVGANGAGKTTLLRALASGAGRATSGGDTSPRVVLLPQEGGGFAACTAEETLRLAARSGGGRGHEGPLSDAWLQRLGLATSRRRLCAELSSAQRRLLDLGRAVLTRPDVLLCDEPLAGLDDAHRAAAAACLRAAAGAGLTIVVAEHDRETLAQLTSNVVELHRPAETP